MHLIYCVYTSGADNNVSRQMTTRRNCVPKANNTIPDLLIDTLDAHQRRERCAMLRPRSIATSPKCTSVIFTLSMFTRSHSSLTHTHTAAISKTSRPQDTERWALFTLILQNQYLHLIRFFFHVSSSTQNANAHNVVVHSILCYDRSGRTLSLVKLLSAVHSQVDRPEKPTEGELRNTNRSKFSLFPPPPSLSFALSASLTQRKFDEICLFAHHFGLCRAAGVYYVHCVIWNAVQRLCTRITVCSVFVIHCLVWLCAQWISRRHESIRDNVSRATYSTRYNFLVQRKVCGF